MKVDFFSHTLGSEEIEGVTRVLHSRFLTYGPEAKAFEQEFGQFLDVPNVVVADSCTSALFLALAGIGIGEGDEVIVPSLTFLATANSVFHAGAKPVFADIDINTGNIDLESIKQKVTPRTKAIIAVHMYGQMMDVKAISDFATPKGIAVIEDAAHCTEGKFSGYRPGTHSTAACFSFYATKNAVATKDAALADRVRRLTAHGMSKSAADRYHGKFQPWDMISMGYKKSLTDIQAAILRPQLKRIDEIASARKERFEYYSNALSKKVGDRIRIPSIDMRATHAYHLFPILTDRRTDLMNYLIENDIGVGIHYNPIHLTSYYKDQMKYTGEGLRNTEDFGAKTLSLPFHAKLTREEQDFVVDTVAKFYDSTAKRG
jgi:dTDP-4-amino-4,6-dideoxygalactose transaminase